MTVDGHPPYIVTDIVMTYRWELEWYWRTGVRGGRTGGGVGGGSAVGSDRGSSVFRLTRERLELAIRVYRVTEVATLEQATQQHRCGWPSRVRMTIKCIL